MKRHNITGRYNTLGLKNCIIVLNTNMIKTFNDEKIGLGLKFSQLSMTFPEFLLIETINANPYVHALLFTTQEDRDKVLTLLDDYKETFKIKCPFYYKGENITDEMLEELYEEHGNFTCWEKYFTNEE